MICLGIEGTSHTFGVGIITDKGKILANEKSVYKPQLGKGIVPQEAKIHHEAVKEVIFKNALKKANLEISDVDIIAYAGGPGLSPCLLVGADFGISLAKKHNKPLIPVHHGIGHIEIGRLTTGAINPIVLYLSGGHNSLLSFVENSYKVFGETLDITCANALDVVAREMNLPFPGGPEIEKLARSGNYVELPYVVKGMDTSYSGILTATIKLFKKGVPKEDICYSLQETCFAMLVEVTERALAHTGKEEVLLVGGVAANKMLQEMLNRMCHDRGAKFYAVPHEYSSDNGAMIGWAGVLAYKSGWEPNFKDKIKPNWRIDEVGITWIK